jgi:hypothetical protein
MKAPAMRCVAGAFAAKNDARAKLILFFTLKRQA